MEHSKCPQEYQLFVGTLVYYAIKLHINIFHEESKSLTQLSASPTCIRVIFLVGEKSRRSEVQGLRI